MVNYRTLRKILYASAARLKACGVDSPRLSAELIIAKALETSRLEVLIQGDRVLSDKEWAKIQALMQRREHGEPVAYIQGTKEFYSLSFKVSPDVLIPRPETELIVDLVKKTRSKEDEFIFADICTGSGNIAVSLATEFPLARGIISDISLPALKVACENTRRIKVQERIAAVCMDLTNGLKPSSIDIFIANPPYLSQEQFSALSCEVKDYEPSLALIGGKSGMEIQKDLIDQAGCVLRSKGWLLMETDQHNGQILHEYLLTQDKTWREANIHQDYSGWERVLTARRQ